MSCQITSKLLAGKQSGQIVPCAGVEIVDTQNFVCRAHQPLAEALTQRATATCYKDSLLSRQQHLGTNEPFPSQSSQPAQFQSNLIEGDCGLIARRCSRLMERAHMIVVVSAWGMTSA